MTETIIIVLITIAIRNTAATTAIEEEALLLHRHLTVAITVTDFKKEEINKIRNRQRMTIIIITIANEEATEIVIRQ